MRGIKLTRSLSFALVAANFASERATLMVAALMYVCVRDGKLDNSHCPIV